MSSENPLDAASADEPHPEIAAYLQTMRSTPVPPYFGQSPEGARQFMKEVIPTPDEPEPVGDVMELNISDADIPLRVYIPEGDGPYPVLVFFHGGGWVLGDLDTHDATCRALTNQADCMVVSVGYRRSPEHRFPVPLEDCYTAIEWVFESGETMQIDTDRVAIGGDSAGGNLAAAATHLLRDRDGPSVTHQVLIYPVTNYSFDTDSYRENGEGYIPTKAEMEWFWDCYLRDDIDGMNPYASPLKSQTFQKLPSATVVTCGFDPLRDEGAAYAQKLKEAGIGVNYINHEDAIHGIAQLIVDPIELTRGKELISEVAEDLQAKFE